MGLAADISAVVFAALLIGCSVDSTEMPGARIDVTGDSTDVPGARIDATADSAAPIEARTDAAGLRVYAAAVARTDTTEYREERLRMVTRQIERRGIENESVLEAMRTVPRHRFVSQAQADGAYDDRPLPIGHGQTISQPYIVAYMTALVDPDPSDVVLEIGTGSGYQAAVLAEIVDRVYTIEIVSDLARTARSRLAELGYERVHVRNADGYYGWMEQGPFDAVVVTAAAEHIPPPLVEQLAEGGRMVIPVGSPFRTQTLMLVEKEGERISTRSLTPVRFVPFTRAN